MLKTRGVPVVWCVVGVTMLVSCGGGSGDSLPASEAPDSVEAAPTETVDDPPVETVEEAAAPDAGGVCGLLTQEEVDAALGAPALAGVPGEEGGVSTCDWESTVPSVSARVSSPIKLTIAVLPYGPAEKDLFMQLSQDVDNLVLDGIGDTALLEGGISPGPIYIVKGDRYLDVDLSNFAWPEDYTKDEVGDLLITIAKAAAGRL